MVQDILRKVSSVSVQQKYMEELIEVIGKFEEVKAVESIRKGLTRVISEEQRVLLITA